MALYYKVGFSWLATCTLSIDKNVTILRDCMFYVLVFELVVEPSLPHQTNDSSLFVVVPLLILIFRQPSMSLVLQAFPPPAWQATLTPSPLGCCFAQTQQLYQEKPRSWPSYYSPWPVSSPEKIPMRNFKDEVKPQAILVPSQTSSPTCHSPRPSHWPCFWRWWKSNREIEFVTA